MQARVEELRHDTTKPKEEILAEMNEILASDVFTSSSNFQNETLPRLAYVMYVEANVPAGQLFSKLTEEQYLFWLMTIDQDELMEVAGKVLEIWQAGAKTHSKPKN